MSRTWTGGYLEVFELSTSLFSYNHSYPYRSQHRTYILRGGEAIVTSNQYRENRRRGLCVEAREGFMGVTSGSCLPHWSDAVTVVRQDSESERPLWVTLYIQ